MRRLADIHIRLVATRIAIADAENPAGAAQLEVDKVVRPPGRTGLARPCTATVMMLTSSPSALMAGRSGVSLSAAGRAGGLDFVLGHDLAGLETFGRKGAGRVFHLPAQVRVLRHGLFAEALAVEEQFDFVAVAEAAHINLLAFLAGPVPVRQQVQHRRGRSTRPGNSRSCPWGTRRCPGCRNAS